MKRRLQRQGLDIRHRRVRKTYCRMGEPGITPAGHRGIALLVAAPLIPVLILLIITVSLVVGCSDQKSQAVSLVRVALQHRESNRHSEAIQVLNRAIALDPKLSEARYLRGLSHAELKQQRESVTDLSAAIRIRPGWDEAWWALGTAQRTTGETALAIKSYTEAVRLTPTFVAALFDRACAYDEFGDAEKSLQDLESVLLLDPDHNEALLRRATALAGSRHDEAIKDLSRILSRDRGNAAAWLLRGLCWHRSGDTDRALADLNIACRMRADDCQPWLERGRVLRQSGRFSDAVSDLSMAVQLGPANAECLYELSRAFADAGNEAAALANLNQALSVDTTHPEALQLRAEMFSAMHRDDEAVADYTRLISLGAKPELMLQRARLHFEAERWEEALADFTTVLEMTPESAEALANRAAVYDQTGRPALAVADLTTVLRRDPSQGELLRRRSELFTELGESDAALADMLRFADTVQFAERNPEDEATVLDAAVLINRTNGTGKALEFLNRAADDTNDRLPSSLMLLRSEFRLQCGDPDGAERDLDGLNEIDAASIRALAVKAGVAVHRSQDSLAVELLDAVSEAEQTPELLMLRGAARSRAGLPEAAAADFSTILKTRPDDITALLARASAFAVLQNWKRALADAQSVLKMPVDRLASFESQAEEALRIRAVSLFHLGRFDDAIADLNSPGIMNHDSLNLLWVRCQCLYELDQDFLAMAELERLLDTAPDHEAARLLRARLADEQGLFDVAVSDLSSVIDRQPEHADALTQRGLLLHRRGQFESAISDFDRVLTLQPGTADIYYRRGLARHQLQQNEQALEDLDHCLLLNPQSADAVYVKGNIEAGRGNTETALALYAKALEIAPTHAAAWYNRGNLLFNSDDSAAAVECWTKAIEFQPNLFRAYNNRAAALVKLDRAGEAVQDYERALELSPGFARARDNYAWLLATSEDPAIRDTTRAVLLAKDACELSGHQDWTCLNTLATAYAEAGDMTQAVDWAKKSRQQAPKDEQAELDKLVRLYESRAGHPARSSTAIRNSGTKRQ